MQITSKYKKDSFFILAHTFLYLKKNIKPWKIHGENDFDFLGKNE